MTPRRRLLPWAILVAIAVVGIAVVLAVSGDDEPPAAGEGTPTTTRSLTQGLATDEPAPDFDADGFDGPGFRLSEHFATDGRPVLLNLWASWCFPCREEMPALDAVAGRNPDVFFLGVAVEDDPVEAEKFAEEIGVSYLLTIDETDAVAEKYPALGLPATFLISPEGRVVGKLFGGATEETFEAFLGLLDT